MGRTPVREAMRRLALEGLIVVYPRRGTFASTVNITSLSDITDVRVQLEPHAAERAAPAGRRRRPPRGRRADRDAGRRARPSQTSLIELDARIHRFVTAAPATPTSRATSTAT